MSFRGRDSIRLFALAMAFAAAVAVPVAEAQMRRINIGPQRIGDNDPGGARSLGNCCGTVFGIVFVGFLAFGGYLAIQALIHQDAERRNRVPPRRKRKRRARDDDEDDDPPPRRRRDPDDDDDGPIIRSVR